MLKDESDAGIRHAGSPRGQSTSTSSTADNTTPKRPRDGCAKEVAARTPTPRKEKVIRGRIEKKGTPAKSAKAAYPREVTGEMQPDTDWCYPDDDSSTGASNHPTGPESSGTPQAQRTRNKDVDITAKAIIHRIAKALGIL